MNTCVKRNQSLRRCQVSTLSARRLGRASASRQDDDVVIVSGGSASKGFNFVSIGIMSDRVLLLSLPKRSAQDTLHKGSQTIQEEVAWLSC